MWVDAMSSDGAITFGDLADKLDLLLVRCDKCRLSERYRVPELIKEQGRDVKIVDWLDKLTAYCPKKRTGNMSDQCGVRCPHLPKVL
jgi:hypothetical protein